MRIFAFQILGSNGNIYHTRLMEDGNHFYHTCSCPSSHNKKCKHINQLLAGETKNIVDFDQTLYSSAIEAISSFKRGVHVINKARVKHGLTPICRVCGNEMYVVFEKKNWLHKLFDSNSSSKKQYACSNCKEGET
jgi:hypothetical protein